MQFSVRVSRVSKYEQMSLTENTCTTTIYSTITEEGKTMGNLDALCKAYMSDANHFADLFNFFMYGGD